MFLAAAAVTITVPVWLWLVVWAGFGPLSAGFVMVVLLACVPCVVLAAVMAARVAARPLAFLRRDSAPLRTIN